MDYVSYFFVVESLQSKYLMKTGLVYLTAIGATAVAVLARWLFDPWIGNNVPFATLYGAVALAVWYGGYRPGIAATIVGYLASKILFIEPRYSVSIETTGNLLALVLYLSTCGIIVGVTESMRRARSRAESSGRELQRAAETIRRQAALVQAVNDNTAELIFMKDRAGRLTYVNAATLRIIGMTQEQAVGSVDRENFTIPAEHAAIAENDRIVAETGRPLQVDEVYTDREGREHIFLTTKSPVRDERGEVTGVIGVALEITERRRHEKELEESRKTLFELVERCPFGIYIVDADFRIVNMNAESQQGAFANVRTVIGRRFDEAMRILWPEPVATDVIEKFLHTLDTGEPFFSKGFVNRRADIDRTEGYEWELHRITLGDGRRGVVCYYFDSTKLRETEAALREAQERLAAELSAMTRLHSLSSRLLAAADLTTALNDLLEHAVAASRADYGNIQLYDAESGALRIVAQRGFEEEFLDHFRTVRLDDGWACARALQSGERIVIEDVETDAAYEPRRRIAAAAGYRAVQSTPLKAHDGSIVGMLSTHYRSPHRPSDRDLRLFDMYARHAADLVQRSRLEQALKEADRRKDEFLATLAHELRNPIAPISSAVQLLGKMRQPYEKLQQVRETIERNVNHMVRLVDDLLEVSRISTGKIELRRKRVNLADVARNAVETSGPWIAARRHELNVDLPTEPVEVDGDAVRLTQVVANLLNNAANYTPEGGRVWVAVEPRDGRGIVTVRDDGPGIPIEMLDKVFDLFTQIKDGLHRTQGGLGIGLSLVKRLVEMHGGRVEARRPAGGGAEFVVALPLASGTARQGDDEREAAHETGRDACRILVVDDNVDAADCLAMVLSAEGHTVQSVYDGRTAVERVSTFKPDVLLLDLGMPGIDGFETAKRVRKLPEGAAVVIAALTGWGQEKDRRRTKDAGFDFHLVKPVRSGDLRPVL
jgi:PAS domain S-box-containing protein